MPPVKYLRPGARPYARFVTVTGAWSEQRDGWSTARSTVASPAASSKASPRAPLTQTVGEPEQIAAAHLYLIENQFVTGTVLTVVGGLILTGSRPERSGPGGIPAGISA